MHFLTLILTIIDLIEQYKKNPDFKTSDHTLSQQLEFYIKFRPFLWVTEPSPFICCGR